MVAIDVLDCPSPHPVKLEVITFNKYDLDCVVNILIMKLAYRNSNFGAGTVIFSAL